MCSRPRARAAHGGVGGQVYRGIPYNRAVDIWTCGCIMHVLLVGSPPFEAPRDATLEDFAQMVIHGAPGAVRGAVGACMPPLLCGAVAQCQLRRTAA